MIVYAVSECNIINPQNTSVLDDFGDDRLTVITCTNDGKTDKLLLEN